ncbi:hypothetical protein PVIIG_06039 [Plasmodium vivax India VII]|uniref:Uncharacterized protein n=1 Tax=Plasmodium vivax India VII TaxID=1077284 RepID=A0A0J9UTH6_PLAVI|nr:hypothetical protein PVIIG_06039 [Plasmodium vivax India VII]
MSCPKQTKEESYEFFENIGDYIEKAKSAENSAALFIGESGCNFFMNSYGHYFKDVKIAKTVCEQFKKLYDLLPELKSNSNSDTNYNKSSQFLNYWVNFKLRESMQNEEDSACDVYNYLENSITDSNGGYILLEFIYDINKDDLYNMNILYRLYKKYTDIDGILENTITRDKELLLSFSTACCTDYLEAKHMCSGGNDDDNNNSQFCKQLQKFETTYEGLYNRVDKKGPEYTNNFKRLTQCNNNTVSTAVIGTTVGLVPLLVGLYKVK